MSMEHSREARQARLYPHGIHVFDLGSTAATLAAERTQDLQDRQGSTLVKQPNLRVVLQTMRAQDHLHEHTAPGPITVHVLQGQIRFQARDEVIYLRPGELLALPPAVPHAVEAVEDSVFLLTIAPSA